MRELETIVEWLFPPQCGGCGALGTGLCTRCLSADAPPLSLQTAGVRVTALGPYEGGLRRGVLAFKRGRRDVAEAFASRLAGHVGAGDRLVPVPTTAVRRRERGFDGCVLLAARIAAHRRCSVVDGLLQTGGDAQHGRTRSARLAARGRFAWRLGALEGRRVVLLDDVVTTGATLADCAAVVRAAGGIVERAVVIARAELEPSSPCTRSIA